MNLRHANVIRQNALMELLQVERTGPKERFTVLKPLEFNLPQTPPMFFREVIMNSNVAPTELNTELE